MFLFNLFVKTFFKSVSALSTVQLSSFYHSALRYSVAKKIDEFIVRIFFSQLDKILAISDNTKNEVLLLRIERSKVKRIYCAYEDLPWRTSPKSQNGRKRLR